ncbi:hypothetical protein EC991_006709 [Linnemannia zychae]|nr:hypothetical protein EC991_006709 [Linnemannia zychae]
MYPLSRLPLECLQRILHTIAVEETQASFTVLTKLALVNRYISMATIPFLYRNPSLFYTNYSNKRGTRSFYRTLLASIPLANLHPTLLLEFNLEESNAVPISSPPLNYLHHLVINPDDLWECSLQGYTTAFVQEKSSDIQEILNRLPSEYASTFQSEDTLLKHCYCAFLVREMSWSLASPILEQLETLSIPTSDIRRYHQVISRIPKLAQLYIVLDDVYDRGGALDSLSTNTVREEAVMQDIVHFVEEHTRLFAGRLKCVRGLSSQVWPGVCYNITTSAQHQIFSLLPPFTPTLISNNNWDQFMTHPLTTNLSEVQSIWGLSSAQWHQATRENLQILQRCRSLKEINTVSIGRGSFAWAVEEKKTRLRKHGAGSADSSDGGQVSQSTPTAPDADLVPLEEVVMFGYHSLTDEIDDIAYAFSQTLKRLIVLGLSIEQEQLATIHFGQGWVNLPVLTKIILSSRRHRVVIDPMLLMHCPSLEHATMLDATTEYQCQDINSCLPASLPRLQNLELDGWPALTFHPATLHSTPLLEVIRLSSRDHLNPPCFIPPIEELKRSYGILGGGVETEAATLGPVRPLWTWDWHLPMLETLELYGEFALLFEFRMLSECPALDTLTLNIRSTQGDVSRVLTMTDFLHQESSAERLRKRRKEVIVVRSLKSLDLSGYWVLDDALLTHLLDCMFPKLDEVTMTESSGFSLRCLVDLVRTKVKHISSMKFGLLRPSEEEGAELGLYLRKFHKKDKKVAFPYKIRLQGVEYLLLRDPSVLAERRER